MEEISPAVNVEASFLAAFHAGERRAIALCYQDHFAVVLSAVRRVLPGSDAETVVHDVFHRLLASPELRANFTGGSLSAWLVAVARNQALDHWRRVQREQALTAQLQAEPPPAEPSREEELWFQELTERFRAVLPERWRRVFDARFIEQRTQREAAQKLGMRRTTLAYQELRIRGQLVRFLRRQEDP